MTIYLIVRLTVRPVFYLRGLDKQIVTSHTLNFKSFDESAVL